MAKFLETVNAFPDVAFLILVFIFVVVFTWLVLRAVSTPFNIPPGPKGIPLLGYLPFIGEKAHVTFDQLAKKYGNIYSMYLGRRLVVVLNSYEVVKAALVKQGEIFHGKPGGEYLRKNDIPSIFQSEGELWRDYRRFSLTTLRDFGLGKLSLEPRIKEEIQFLLDMIESYKGKPTDIGDLLRMSISDVICSIIFGKRFEYSDKDFQYLLKVLNDFLLSSRIINVRYLVPYLLQIPGAASWLGYIPMHKKRDILQDYMKKKVNERAAVHQPGNEGDFIAAWLTEAERRGPVDGKHFTKDHLTMMVMGLFIAGSDTTANTLRWALVYLMHQPEVQALIQKEIDEVIGHERTPSITDQELMPYTQATLIELHRIASLVPNIPHCNMEDTTLEGYFIPKRSVIYVNLWAVHNNPETYPEPEKFRPERFLNSEGEITKEEKLIPFSMGKRQCLGESLARVELFLYLTSMLQRFTFTKPENDVISFDYDMSMVSMPRPYRVIATVRKEAK